MKKRVNIGATEVNKNIQKVGSITLVRIAKNTNSQHQIAEISIFFFSIQSLKYNNFFNAKNAARTSWKIKYIKNNKYNGHNSSLINTQLIAIWSWWINQVKVDTIDNKIVKIINIILFILDIWKVSFGKK